MSGRSLQASSKGIEKSRRALIQHSLTQKALAEELEMSRQPVSNFFAGKAIDRKYFYQICEKLGFEWDDIIVKPYSKPEAKSAPDNGIDIDILMQEVREKIKASIQERCGTMRVLDMSQPIGLNDIYTNVNILEKITGRRRKEIAELLLEFKLEDFERFGMGRISEERVPGLEAVEKYSRLMLLGKPGAGKTTFLKYVAIQCNGGEFQVDRVPIFITLKNFAEAANKPSLMEYISQQFIECGVTDAQVTDLFSHSKALVLLDGLDEVRKEDNSRVLEEIRNFSERFYGNHFVMTCRIAAREYIFDKFTEVEIADFDDKQIATFATNWFKNKAGKAESFINRLESNHLIKELATNPLLLTLLCLVFEGSMNFPSNRSKLYEEGLKVLLKKWDAGRRIERNQVYEKLSLKRKEELLSKIALATFERGDYLFMQKVAEQYITDYIRNLPNANTEEEELQPDSEDVLRSIEAQHGLLVERAKGIYSFSHLTFHEYFTAREFIVVKQSSEEALQNLVSYITEKRWREVFLLAVGMSPSADCLLQLIKQQVDDLVAEDMELQQFLMWVRQKSLTVDVPYKPAAVRALYLGFSRTYNVDRTDNLARTVDSTIVPSRAFALNSALAFSRTYSVVDGTDNLARTVDSTIVPSRAFALDFAFDRYLVQILHINIPISYDSFDCIFDFKPIPDPVLWQLLLQLKNQLPSREDREEYEYQAWAEKLKNLIIEHRNIGHNWQFSEQQKQLLRQYYNANEFLLECLNSDCCVSREVRQEIEDTLLLPIAEIEQLKG